MVSNIKEEEEEEFESELLLPINTDPSTVQNEEEIVGGIHAFSEITTTSASVEDITAEEIETTIATTFDCERDGYLMVPYRTVYIFLIVMASILVLITIGIVAVYVVRKKKRFPVRHGEYKLTTMRTLPTKIRIDRAVDVEKEDAY